jgi:DNA-binding response OmpR family regulator
MPTHLAIRDAMRMVVFHTQRLNLSLWKSRMTCILVVEDESDVREPIVEVLQDAGFQIIEAATADAATAWLNLKGLSLIVTDINLPGRLNGIDLAATARHVRPGIPVIFISGRAANLEEAHALGGPAAFLLKPFSFTTLVEDVQRMARVVCNRQP